MTGDPGVLPAFPSPSPGARGCSYLIPRRSRRCARLWGSRCGGPGKPEALDSTASWPLSGCGDSERPTRGSAQRPRSPVRPGMVNFSRGSYVGSEPGAAENVLGRDRAPTHSPLSTEPPTYFNPPPSLLPPSPLLLPSPPPPSPCLRIPPLPPLPPNHPALRMRPERESFADPGSRLWQRRSLGPGLPGAASPVLQSCATLSALLGPRGPPRRARGKTTSSR